MNFENKLILTAVLFFALCMALLFNLPKPNTTGYNEPQTIEETESFIYKSIDHKNWNIYRIKKLNNN